MTLARASSGVSLQTALFTRLDTDISSADVYDFVPQDTKMPYIKIGEDFRTPDNTKTDTGDFTLATIHVFSDKKGSKEVKEILGEIETSIFRANFDLTGDGFTHLGTELVTSEDFEDEDGKSMHGIIQVRFQIEKN